jgi:hypothetical protein
MITQKVDLYSDSDTEPDRGNVLAHIIWKGKEHGLYDGENIIGREDDCDVVLDHESVSLKHAVLDFEDGLAKLRDLKSKNGTSVESAPGGGSYVKLGPMRRNVIVSSGCRIRFGLVDCKFVHVGGPPADKPAPPNLNINCETQFINLGPVEDQDSEEEEAEAFTAVKAASGGGSVLPHPVPEQDTQVAASLTSAEKAPAAYLHSPSPLNFISGLVGSSRTPLAVGNANVGIGYGNSPPSGGTAGSTDALLRRSKASPASAVRAPPLATSSPNDTDVDDETEDEGGAMDQDELPPPLAAPTSRPPAPAGRDLDTTLMGDSDDDGSEMSQDLLHVADGTEPTEGVEHEDGEGRDDFGRAARVQRGAADLEGTQSEHGDEDDEINFAQPEARTADSTVGPTSGRGPQRTSSLSDALGSPFHGIGESAAYFTADTHPDGPGAAPHEPDLSPVREPMVEEEETGNTEQKGLVTASLESLSDLPVTASSNGGVPATSPSARSRSATVDDAENGKARSPATAIQNLLQRSGMKDGARVFNTQGDIISMGHSGTGSPRLTSQSSAPPDAPKLGFDFAAARDAAAPLLDAADHTGTGKADDDEEGMDVESPMPTDRRAKAAAARVNRSASVAPPSAAGVRGARKRVLEDSDDDDDAPVAETGTASARKSRQGAASGPGGTASKERNVRARKTRSNDPGDAGAPLPVTTEVPFSPSKKLEEAEATKRKRFLDDGNEEEAEFDADDGLVTHSVGPAKVPSPEVAPKKMESKSAAAKKGRGKAAVGLTGGEEQGAGAEEAQTASTAPTVKKGRGRVGFAAEEAVLEEPAEPGAPTAANKGRGKKQVSEEPPEAAEPAHEATAEPSAHGKTAGAPGKKGTKKATAEASVPKDTAEHVTAVEEPPAAVAAVKASAKKGAKKSEQQAVSEAPVHADAAPAPAPAAGKRAGKKGATASAVEKVHDATAAAEEAGTSSAATAADTAVRVMFTKVEDGPYLKGLKSLPHVSVVADATEATHCVTLSELKRTPKLMVALNCGAQYVVTEQWAKDCVKSKSVVDVVSAEHAAGKKGSKLPKDLDPRVNAELYQQLLSSPYIVHDAEKEKLWKFSLAATLAIPRHQPGERKLFEGLCFFCTKGVCGETAPPADELCAIIESGGGVWLTSLEDWLEHHAQVKGASPAGKGGSSSKSGGKGKAGAVGASGNDVQSSPALVVLTHPNVKKNEVTKKVSDAVAKCNAPAAGVYSMELVFLACLRQRMDFDESRL